MTFFRACHLGIIFGQFVQHVDLQLGRLPVLLHVLDDLDGNHPPLVEVFALHHLPKSAFSQLRNDLVPTNGMISK